MNHEKLQSEAREWASQLLQEDKKLIFRMQGYSMYPTLKPGDSGVVESCRPDELKPGQVIVFQQGDHFVAHRIISVSADKTTLIARGDNNDFKDAPVEFGQIKGLLVCRIRKGKETNLTRGTEKMRTEHTLKYPDFTFRYNRILFQINTLPQRLTTPLKNWIFNLKTIIQGSEKWLIINLLITLFQSVLPLLIIYLFKLIVDALQKSGGQSQQIIGLLIITAVMFLLNSIVTEIRAFYTEKLNQSVTRHTYEWMQQVHIRLDLSWFESSDKQDAMHQAVQESSYRPIRVIGNLLSLSRAVFSALLIAAMYFWIQWYFALVLIVAVMPRFFLKIIYSRRYFHFRKEQLRDERMMQYYHRVLTAQPFARELRLFGFSQYFKSLFQKTQDKLNVRKTDILRKEMIPALFSQIFAVALLFLMLVFVIYGFYKGSTSVGTVVLFLFLFQRGYSTVSELFGSFGAMVEDYHFLRLLGDFQKNYPVDNVENQQAVNLKGDVEVQNVSFRYPQGKKDALKHISLEIKAGQTIAITGSNGSGKTTLIKLLAGLYPPKTGQITYDNQKMVSEQLKGNVSAVFQDFALYQVSVGDNIRLGRIDKYGDLSSEEMKSAVSKDVKVSAEKADILKVIEKFKYGMNQPLGVLDPEAEEMSMGQWQKLALARALYADTPLLLLDEPTSALDADSELHLVEMMQKMAQNKTTVIVSHHLSMVEWVDKILFLSGGEITESGTHKELMELKGAYYALYTSHKKLRS